MRSTIIDLPEPFAKYCRRRFLIGSGIILIVTGLAKILTIFGDTSMLLIPDPVFRIEFRALIFWVGLGEIAVASFCLFSKRQTLSTIMVAWIASAFLVYRAGIGMIGWERPCGCLGNLSDIFGISPHAVEWISLGLLGFLLIGSYAVLFIGFKDA